MKIEGANTPPTCPVSLASAVVHILMRTSSKRMTGVYAAAALPPGIPDARTAVGVGREGAESVSQRPTRSRAD